MSRLWWLLGTIVVLVVASMFVQWSLILSPNVATSVTTSKEVISMTTLTSTGAALLPRQVGPPTIVSGEVVSISKNPYSLEASLNVTSANATFKEGDIINIRFSGIGLVSSWKVWYLKVGDKVEVIIRFVENSHWEAYDSDWSIITT